MAMLYGPGGQPLVMPASQGPSTAGNVCRQCGCVDEDCTSCVERTGEPCLWVEPDLCSGCALESLKELPAPPCGLCGQDDRMKQLPYTVTDFGGVIMVWVCRRDGMLGSVCLGREEG